MVRSSSSSTSTKEKKASVKKPTSVTKAKSSAVKASKSSGSTPQKPVRPVKVQEPKAQKTVIAKKEAPARQAKSTTATKKVETTAAKSTAAKSTAAKLTAVKKERGQAAVNESVKVKKENVKTKASKTQTAKTAIPRTPELFEDFTHDSEIPSVSVVPSLVESARALASEAGAELTPAPREFPESPVHQFEEAEGQLQSSAVPVVAAKSTVSEDVTFSFLGFSDVVLEAIRKQNFKKPTRVQALCLPHALDGKDVAGFAQTGTGKTAVYLLTAAHKLLAQEQRTVNPHKPQVLVVVPTRELADQVSQDAKKLLSPLKLKSLAVFGGVDVERHVNELNQPVDIVVATPGRLLDLHRSKHLEFDDLQLLVIDECDRMFDMGFVDDVEYVLRHLPSERVQKLLFSATGSEKVKELAFEYLENPEYIETDPVQVTPERISQVAYAVPAEQKFLTLMGHLRAHNPECAIVFTNTKVVAEWIGYKLACNGLAVEVLTGDLPQRKRMSLIKKIKDGQCNLLIATDVLSRGLHVANLSHVYNFDIPDDAESFIHRIGRTARAGATGHAITLICDDYGYNMGAVENLLGFKIPLKDVPREYLSVEDVSDYPFDENGRVKVFGHATASTEKAGGQVPAKASRPESTLPHHQRREPLAGPVAASTPSAGKSAHAARPAPHAPAAHPVPQTQTQTQPAPLAQPMPQPKSVSHPQSAPQAAMPSAPQPAMPSTSQPQRVAAAQGQGQGPRHQGGIPTSAAPKSAPAGQMPQSQSGASARRPAHAAAPSTSAASGAAAFPRRDEKARETIELAIHAARKAAAKRQSTVVDGAAELKAAEKSRTQRVTSHIDEVAAAMLNSAQERFGDTLGNLQDRFVSRLEENFPRLSETLIRLGFFSKRFTDDR